MKKKNTLGIISMILGIIGLLLSCLLVGVIPAFFGLILGIIALTQKDAKKGAAIAGTVCSAIAVLIFVFVMAAGQGSSDSDKTEDETKYEEASDVSVNDENKSEPEETKKEDKKEDKVDYIEITSTELIAVYDENQVKCTKEYDGKKLKVTGTVTNIGTDIMDNIYVCLGSDEEYTFVGIQCYAKDKDTEDKIAELKEGDVITVIGKGECGSFTFSIKNAEIIE